jgi:hypothetical protein
MWAAAEETVKANTKHNPVNDELFKRLTVLNTEYGTDVLGRIAMNIHGQATQAFYGFFGADPVNMSGQAKQELAQLGYRGIGKLGRTATVVSAVFGIHQLLLGGALGSMETSSELRDIYEGRKLIEVKKGRFWEGGGTPYEGDRTAFFRPHWVHLVRTGAEEASVWGEDYDKYSPITKFALKNFTYHLERENYYNRPYPVSGAAFADVPVIGGLLASTVGQLIKPAKIMHAGEWIRPGENGGLEFASVFRGSRQEPSYELGANEPGIPQSPFSAKEQLAFLSYQFRELEGLTGWAKNVIQNTLTGSELWNTDSPILASANDMSSWRKTFWEMEVGGMLTTNEFLRRFLPRTPYEKNRVNPISNTMPSWLPDKFHYGDPYTLIKTGWARLPGAGYAQLHPELQGMSPDEYPLIYRYSILADVAPYSREFRRTKQMVYRRRLAGEYSDKQQAFIDQVDAQHAKVMNQLNFDHMHPNAIQLPGSQFTQQLYNGSMATLRRVVAPAEYLVPMGFRPAQKFLNDRDPIEEYEYQRMYGTPMSFWDEPWRDWFRPALYSGMNMLGFEGKPLWRIEADATQEYFDKLNYLRLVESAQAKRQEGDFRGAYEAEWAAGQTRAGVNPMGTPLGIYWSLPAEERKFFNAFSHAQGADRESILEMIPEDQAHLYRAVWQRMDEGDPNLWAGEPSTISSDYIQDQYTGVKQFLSDQPMPPEDWIGWNTDVDMNDIQVRYLHNTGRDIHDFGMWESQLKQSMNQPFLEGSDTYIQEQGGIQALRRSIHGLVGGTTTISPSFTGRSSISLSYNDSREGEIQERMRGALYGY